MKKTLLSITLLASAMLYNPSHASPPTYVVDTPGDTKPLDGGQTSGVFTGDLRYCLRQAQTGSGADILFNLPAGQETINLQNILPYMIGDMTIDGSNGGNKIVIDGSVAGAPTYPGFAFVPSIPAGSLEISHMTIQHTISRGGNGGSPNGGGGPGIGGGLLYLGTGPLTLNDLTFNDNLAVGGIGAGDNAATAGGGGGIFGGNGGNSTGTSNDGAGGGGGGYGANGGDGGDPASINGGGGGGGGGVAPTFLGAFNPNGGDGGNGYDGSSSANGKAGSTLAIAAGGHGGKGTIDNGASGGSNGGGGGGGGDLAGGGGGGIAGNPGSSISFNGDGGHGSIFPPDAVGGGGGGGQAGSFGGIAGLIGGGGGGGNIGGNSNYGGGGGGRAGSGGDSNLGGAGGGNGGGTAGIGSGSGGDVNDVGGGGGAIGAGGAIFALSESQITLEGPLTVTNSTVIAGTGANNGASAAASILFRPSGLSPVPLNFNAANVSDVITIDQAIGDFTEITFPNGNSFTPGISPATAQGIVKSGLGKLVLNGNNTYGGPTAVNQGELKLNGSIASDATVASGATISGTGTVGAYVSQGGPPILYGGNLTILSGGTIKPGNSIGTLNVLGNYVQDSGSTYIVEFNGLGQSNLINISGTATINGGQVIAVPLSLPPATTPYLILHADGGRTGTFDGVSASGPIAGRTVALAYDSNNVFLVFTGGSSGGGFVFPGASTCNQRAVAAVFESIVNPTADQLLFLESLAALDAAGQQHALNQISGEQYTVLAATTEITGQQFLRRLYDPLRSIVTTVPCCCNSCYCCPTLDGWLEAGGGQSFLDGNVNCRGLKMNTWEITGGVQSTFCNDWTVGAALSYIHDHVQYRVGGNGNNRTTIGALYGLYRPQGFYVLGDIAFGYSHNRINRPIHINEAFYETKSTPKIFQGLAYAEIGIDICSPCYPCLLLQPFGGIAVGIFERNRVQEDCDNILGLNIRKSSKTNCHTRLGVHLTTLQNSCFNVSLDLAWQYLLSNPEDHLDINFATFGDPYRIYGNTIGRNSFDGALTVTADVACNWQIYLETSGQVWTRASSYNVLAGVKYSW